MTDRACFHGIPVGPDPLTEGAFVLTGPGHDAYLDFVRHMGEYGFGTTAGPLVRTVDPVLIEGVRLNPDEMDDPALFWTQHKPGGTMESFLEIARAIPDAREAFSGKQAYVDTDLAACAGLYLDMDRPDALSLYAGPGFYWFQANGRHRVVAARLAGTAIPARIVGTITRKRKEKMPK